MTISRGRRRTAHRLRLRVRLPAGSRLRDWLRRRSTAGRDHEYTGGALVSLYRVYVDHGGELGDVAYVNRVQPNEKIWLSATRQARVIDVALPEPGAKYDGLLRVRLS